MAKIGFIGVGVMGLPMATNLLKNNHQLKAFDTNTNQTALIKKEGATIVNTSLEATKDVDFVITMLPNGSIVKDVSCGEGGIIHSENKNFIYIDMSTILPGDIKFINDECKKNHINMLDAPVARLLPEAIAGTLLIMVGGEKEIYEKALPIFKCMGDTVYHCGENGTGSTMKLINNYMSIVSNIITAETLTLSQMSNISMDLALEIMRGTAAGKGHMNQTYPNKVLKGDTKAGFTNALATKDLGLAIQHAKDLNFNLQLGAAAKEIYDESLTEISSKDWTSMYEYILKKAKG